MKKLIAFIYALTAVLATAETSCYLNVAEMNGSTNDTTVLIKAVVNPVKWNGRLYKWPVNGVTYNTTNGLLTNVMLVPNRYTAVVGGLPNSFGFPVPDTNAPQNIADLATNLAQYVPVFMVSGVSQLIAGSANVSLSPTNGKGAVTLSVTQIRDASLLTNANASALFTSGIIPAQFISIPAITTNVNELLFSGYWGGPFASMLRQDWNRASDSLFTNSVTADYLTNNGTQWQAWLSGSIRYTNSDASTPVGNWAYTSYPSQYYEVTRADYATNRVVGVFVGDASGLVNVNAAQMVSGTYNGMPAAGIISVPGGLALVNDGGQINGYINPVDQEIQLLDIGNGPWNIYAPGLTVNRYPALNTTSIVQNIVIYTNGAGSKFRLGINTATNGFNFIPVP